MGFNYYKNRAAFSNGFKIVKVNSIKEELSVDDVEAFIYFKNLFKNRVYIKRFQISDFNKKMKSEIINYKQLDTFIIKSINYLFKSMKKISNKVDNIYKTNLFAFTSLILYKIYQTTFLSNNFIIHLSQTNLDLLKIKPYIKNNPLINKLENVFINSDTKNLYTEFNIDKYSNLYIFKDKNYKNIINYIKSKLNQNISFDLKSKLYSLLKIFTALYYNFILTKKGDVLCTLI